ncbi:MAG: hypothetical protein U1F56_12380 [Rubrivivax sp.]
MRASAHPLPLPAPRVPHASGLIEPARRAGLALVLATTAAWAGPLADPTRPPAMLSAPAPAPRGAAAAPRPARATAQRPDAATDAAAAPIPAPPAPALPRLQAVQVPRLGPASALVDGRFLRVGDAVAGATVVAIDNDGLVLHHAGATRRLWLLDAVARSDASMPTLAESPAVPAPAAATAAASAAGDGARSPLASLIGKRP